MLNIVKITEVKPKKKRKTEIDIIREIEKEAAKEIQDLPQKQYAECT